MLAPLPCKNPARLVDIVDRSLKAANVAHAFGTYSDFEEYARPASSFEKVAFRDNPRGRRHHDPGRHLR
jgi:hypothetical protein